jgi:hypothetical protein
MNLSFVNDARTLGQFYPSLPRTCAESLVYRVSAPISGEFYSLPCLN